ncbi:MAG: ABC transporter substrate-binding protein [Tissierellia bacterium]|nr:ABC transporter substrate-binding protein [Tissierellia bacterium]
MKNYKVLKLTAILAAFSLILVACSNTNNTTTKTEDEPVEVVENVETTEEVEDATVEITDIHGTVNVPVNPQTVIGLDNRTFDTLEALGVKLAAAPKDVMPPNSNYVLDESVLNIGNHREPNLEIIAAADPDLVIIGQRFANYYDEIKKLVPNAVVLDFNYDVSVDAENAGDNLINGFKDSTLALGQIFDKNDEAQKIVDEFEKSLDDAKAAYNGTDTIMSIVVSGGEIGFSAPRSGRVWGPLYEIFNWTPALEIEDASADHKGDDVSVEAIAQSNPDWIFVLDRDASVASAADSSSAKDVIENSPALQNTKAITEGNLLYAPDDTYTNESIQTFTKLFQNISEALGK